MQKCPFYSTIEMLPPPYWYQKGGEFIVTALQSFFISVMASVISYLLYIGRHFWNRKCRTITWWLREFALFKCEATANSVAGHAMHERQYFICKWLDGDDR